MVCPPPHLGRLYQRDASEVSNLAAIRAITGVATDALVACRSRKRAHELRLLLTPIEEAAARSVKACAEGMPSMERETLHVEL